MHKILASFGMAAVLVLAACGGGGGGSGDDTTAVDAQVARDGRVLDGGPTVDAAAQVDGAAQIDAAAAIDGATVDARVADARVSDATVTDAGNPLTDAGIPTCVPLPASGGTIIMGETTASSSTWNRPFVDTACPAADLSTVGTAVPYNLHVFCNTGAERQVDIAMDGTEEMASLTLEDPYLVIYSGAGIPADALQCADGNDDFDSSAGSGAAVTNITVTAGGTFTVVATGFENTHFGTYALRLTVH